MLEWAFANGSDEKKLAKGLYPHWFMWGVRGDYVKATNGFNGVVNWVNSLGCEDCIPYKKTSERIDFCEIHEYRVRKNQ